eukprot:m51a1_g9256 hypothetical protein (568) ;mRNA; r:46090-52482
MLVSVALLFFHAVARTSAIGAQDSVPSYPAHSFAYGINLGGPPDSHWDDALLSDIAVAAGASGQRKKLPEAHLERWGYTIEVSDCMHAVDIGMRNLVGFVVGATAAHSKALLAAALPCPHPLTPTQPDHLVEPPLLTQTLSGQRGDVVNINVTVPQTEPGRTNVVAHFENPQTHAVIASLGIRMDAGACSFTGIASFGLPELIRSAQPYIEELPDRYSMRFLIRVNWTETFTLAGRDYTRPYAASVGFEIILYRTLDVSSSITTLDATLVWGYIQKFSVLVPLDRSRPTVEFDLITVAAEADYQIDDATMVISGTEGHIQSINLLTYAGLVDSAYNKQRWHLRAVIDQYSICSTSAADAFSLAFTLRSSTARSATHKTGLRGTLEGLENWCMLNTTVRLNGIQSTHADTTTSDETVRFFLGDWVHVRDHVYTDLRLTRTSVVSAVLSGEALRAAGPVTIYAGTPGTEAYGFALETCPASTDPTWVCYRFQLVDTALVVDKSLAITTTLSAAIDQHGRRDTAPAPQQTARLSNSVNFATRAADQQPAGAASPLAVACSVLLAAAFFLL